MGGRNGESHGRLCAIQGGSVQCYWRGWQSGTGVLSLYEDSRGNLWAGARTGLWRWKPGPPKLYPMPDPVARSDRRRQRRTLDRDARWNQTVRGRENRSVSASRRREAVQPLSAPAGSQWRPVDRNRGPGARACSRGKDGCVCAADGLSAAKSTVSLRIVRAIFGSPHWMAWTAFGISPSPRFRQAGFVERRSLVGTGGQGRQRLARHD